MSLVQTQLSLTAMSRRKFLTDRNAAFGIEVQYEFDLNKRLARMWQYYKIKMNI